MIHPKQRWDTCYYMSSTSKIEGKYLDCFGYIISVQTSPGSRKELISKHPWCMDNDEFNNKFDVRKWIKHLRQCRNVIDNCIFVLARDSVGNCKATLEQFPRYAKIIRRFGYPVAFATQDGLTPDITPWDDFEVLFVGGTNEHKLGREAGLLIDEGIRRGKWVHIGRVNSPSRMRKFWRADSWDGTHIGYKPDVAAPVIARAVREIRAMKTKQYKLWEGF